MTLTSKNQSFCDDEAEIDLKIENTINGFRNYGYRVLSKPPSSSLKLEYYEEMLDGLNNIDKTVEYLENTFNYRFDGKNTRKKAISALHKALPEPCWGVQV